MATSLGSQIQATWARLAQPTGQRQQRLQTLQLGSKPSNTLGYEPQTLQLLLQVTFQISKATFCVVKFGFASYFPNCKNDFLIWKQLAEATFQKLLMCDTVFIYLVLVQLIKFSYCSRQCQTVTHKCSHPSD